MLSTSLISLKISVVFIIYFGSSSGIDGSKDPQNANPEGFMLFGKRMKQGEASTSSTPNSPKQVKTGSLDEDEAVVKAEMEAARMHLEDELKECESQLKVVRKQISTWARGDRRTHKKKTKDRRENERDELMIKKEQLESRFLYLKEMLGHSDQSE